MGFEDVPSIIYSISSISYSPQNLFGSAEGCFFKVDYFHIRFLLFLKP